ncbi:MAG: hypothetical protein ACRC6V_00525, partial [Bacteroidales bacterium]
MRNRKFSRIWLPKLVSLRSEIAFDNQVILSPFSNINTEGKLNAAFDNQVILSLHKSIRKIRDMHTSKCLELDECIVKVKRLEEALKLEQSKTRVEDAKDCFNEAMLDEQAKIIKELKESNADLTNALEQLNSGYSSALKLNEIALSDYNDVVRQRDNIIASNKRLNTAVAIISTT